MSKGDNSPGISKLAGVFQGMVSKGQNTSPALDFGTIQSDGSLLTDLFPVKLPKSEYQVCRHLKRRRVDTEVTTVGDHGTHSHKIDTREWLKVGDRVLVAWVEDDPVVIDIILSADDVL